MKTMEVLEIVLRGKRLGTCSKESYRCAFESLAKFSEEFPTNSGVINEWLASLENYSDQTVRLYFTLVRIGGEYMRKHYKIDNPCDLCEKVRVVRRKRRYFTPEELMGIIGACGSDFNRCLVLTLLDSGCRIGELAKLKRAAVGQDYLDVLGKTGERRYRLDSELCLRLKALANNDDDYVFGNGTESLSAGALSLRVMRLCKKAGIKGKKLGPHSIRHSVGTLVAKYTRSDLAVKAILQHDNIATSMLYVHDAEDEIQKEISPLKLALGSYAEESETQVKMITEVAGEDGEFIETEDVAVDDGLDELMSSPGAGVKVRPILKPEDIELLRCALIDYARGNGNMSRSRCITFYNRMLRKVR